MLLLVDGNTETQNCLPCRDWETVGCSVLSGTYHLLPAKVQGSLQKREQKDCKTQKWFKRLVFPGRAGQLYTWTHSHCDSMHKACMSWNPHRTPARRVRRVPKWISSPNDSWEATCSWWLLGERPFFSRVWFTLLTGLYSRISEQHNWTWLFCFASPLPPLSPPPPTHTEFPL